MKSNITTFPEKTKAGAPARRGLRVLGRGRDREGGASATTTAPRGGRPSSARTTTRFAWRLWSHTFTPKAPGKVRLLARATDSPGGVQPREAVWNQSGYFYNAWHSVEIEVTA